MLNILELNNTNTIMKTIKFPFLLLIILMLFSCSEKSTKKESELEKAAKQFSLLVKDAETANRIPRTLEENGEMHWTKEKWDWTEGFFPGSCWYLFEATKDQKWQKSAEKFQAQFEEHKFRTNNHDLGFVFNCSYGNAYRLTKNEDFKQVMITAADSLSTRFNPNVGCIKSWDVTGGWQAQRGWKYPVIIDNMMNLELLFEVSKLTGNDKYKDIAIIHANTTLKNHFRNDNSSFHVIDYDPETGEVRNKHTAQGFAHTSAWSRGQAWGLYGYTVCYRYTKDEKYLKQAEKIAKFIIEHEGTPKDGIPYWDYSAPNVPNEPRDVSAAAVTVSALIELDGFSKNSYKPAIDKIMTSLSSDQYTAKLGENKHFLLKHSVGSIPHGNEIDVPLNYADYYYLEALVRLKK